MTVTLRPLRPGDEEVAVRWAADPVFCRAADWTPGLAPRVLRRHWAMIIAGGDPSFLRLGAELDGQLVGFVDLAGMSGTSAEFGIVIGARALWGQGVARQAGEALIAHAEGMGLSRMTALVHGPNTRSHALMRRLGFVQAGHADPEAYMGEVVPVIRYARELGSDSPHS
ncbi:MULTISPECIES: GNAT family N-acetyltransferase [unclassified Deinococcus]|uniref:GNAT family N-acetyltransferase n=1 Tax=unclassified Deinococcus TaxID=2623546 RepID=UPI001C30D385|nr:MULTISPECIES: GNAT family protein [unclassified Deinococcus]MDK2011246.1 GNAT family protein [Deinococcus sp. 43]